MSVRRPIFFAVAAAAAFVSSAASAAQLTVHKSPYCGCCAKWIEHVEKHGFTVKVVETEDMVAVKKRLGVPDAMASCHTTQAAGYFIEGHVPAADIKRLLAEKPVAAGIAVPGMPLGSPGMEAAGQKQPYATILVRKNGTTSTYARH
ncbi:MAG TPA: DUF411 domain-containing protein [Sphingomicrobium sp.]|nr:DUF411 domain-containing protein [Sphingomicrobium sp.]